MVRYGGDCFAVEVRQRAETKSPLVVVYIEDDGNWFEKMSFDFAWLPELIELLEVAKLKEDSR